MGFSDADMMGRGGKTGSGRQASESQENQMRRERLRKLALETVDLNKDPYFMRNHLGTYECKLCLTIHTNEGNYLAHTQGKRHQQNIARRLAKDAFEQQGLLPGQSKTDGKTQRTVAKIGRPGYRVTKQKDPESNQRSLLFLIDYPEIEEGLQPRHRFMSAYEQRVEPADKNYQYILVAAEPYETIAFKVPNQEIDTNASKFFTNWDFENKTFTLQIHFKEKKREGAPPPPPPGAPPPAPPAGMPPPPPG
jgi:splicing factor 3A subunit 2